jgi:hypothetical protein
MSVMQLIALLLAILGYLDQSAIAQQFSFAQKGRRQPASSCYATLDHFDGTTLWLKQTVAPTGSLSCTGSSTSSLNWQIQIQLSPDLSVLQGGFQNNNPFGTQGPNIVNPGRIASSIAEATKDVDLQHAELQERQRQAAIQNSRPQSVNPPDIDLTSCKTRGTDTIQTSVNGASLSVSGSIQDISGGWVRMQKTGEAQIQRFRLLDITSITIGSC